MNQVSETASAKEDPARRILAFLQERIGPQKFNAWFRHGTQVSIENGHVKVSVPNSFVANWIESHYCALIASTAQEATGRSRPIMVMIDPALSGEVRKRQLDVQADLVAKSTSGRARPRRPIAVPALRHNLDDFVVGDNNRLAYSAAMMAAGGSRAPFNPLFIHGACGVGKTHLLQGVCSAVSRQSGRHVAWRYVTAEQFTNEYIQAVRKKAYAEFRARYRRLDLLAIDDVHFLAAKKATQDEFLHTFDAIETAGKQVVMASDAHPRLVGELNEQLVSRFIAGMVVKIDPPNRATRMEILRRRAARMRLTVPDDVLDYIAAHVRGSVRELEGALVKLTALAALESGPITLDMAMRTLADHLARTDSVITLGDIEAITAVFFGITPADIHSTRRTKTVSLARMVAMFLGRRHTRMSFPEIGRFMGKNHSSVVLAVQRMEKLLSGNGQAKWMTPMGVKSMPAGKIIELLTEQLA